MALRALNVKTIQYVQNTLRDYYGVDLTQDQVCEIGRRDRSLWNDLKDGCFDTVNREAMVDLVVQEVLGSGHHWPMNGEGSEAFERFYQEFVRKAPARDIRVLTR